MTQSELMRQALIGGRTHESTRSKKSITASVSGIRSANFEMDGSATRSNRRCSTDSGEMNGISVTATSIRIGDMAKAPDRQKTKPAEGGSESPRNCGNCDPPPTGSDESGPLGRVCGQTIMAKNTRVVNQTCRVTSPRCRFHNIRHTRKFRVCLFPASRTWRNRTEPWRNRTERNILILARRMVPPRS